MRSNDDPEKINPINEILMRSLTLFLVGGLSQSRSCNGLDRFRRVWITKKLRCFRGDGLRGGFCLFGRHGIWFGLCEILNFLPNTERTHGRKPVV